MTQRERILASYKRVNFVNAFSVTFGLKAKPTFFSTGGDMDGKAKEFE